MFILHEKTKVRKLSGKREAVNSNMWLPTYRGIQKTVFDQSPLKDFQNLSYEEFHMILESAITAISSGMFERWRSSDMAKILGTDGELKQKLVNTYYASLNKLRMAK